MDIKTLKETMGRVMEGSKKTDEAFKSMMLAWEEATGTEEFERFNHLIEYLELGGYVDDDGQAIIIGMRFGDDRLFYMDAEFAGDPEDNWDVYQMSAYNPIQLWVSEKLATAIEKAIENMSDMHKGMAEATRIFLKIATCLKK